MTQDLRTCAVQIRDASDAMCGTGFIVDADTAFTCAHVIEAADAGPGKSVTIAFALTGDVCTAEVLPTPWSPPDEDDIAVLRFSRPLPEGVTPATLGASEETQAHPFSAFGYPPVGDLEGVWADGKIIGPVTDVRGAPGLQLRSQEIQQGMSGAPVLDTDNDRVIGMLTETYIPDETGKFRDAAFATPMEAIQRVWPALLLTPAVEEPADPSAPWEIPFSPPTSVSKDPSSIFISYKRNVHPDEALALYLRRFLSEAGHAVFIDQAMTIGVEWATEIKRLIAESDCLIVLLSAASVSSEMVPQEIEYARETQTRLLPVRVNYAEALPYPLNTYLDPIHQAEWQTWADTPRLAQQLLDAVEDAKTWQREARPVTAPVRRIETGMPRPKAQADPGFISTLQTPGGAVRLGTRFYVRRDADDQLELQMGKATGTTTTIRGPRQTGKTSLLIRGCATARQTGHQVVYLDLLQVDSAKLLDAETFLRYLAEVFVSELVLDAADLERAWQSSVGANTKFTSYLRNDVLSKAASPIVLAMDEVERLLQTSFSDDFFGMVRAWHNRRAWDEPWDMLDILMVISTEPYLLIQDVNRSPFNVGLKLRLEDLTPEQVEQLNTEYRSPLGQQHLNDFMALFGGHPFLTQQALYTMVVQNLAWEELVKISYDDTGPFGSHLRRFLWLLQDQPDLTKAMQRIVRNKKCSDQKLIDRLSGAGLVKGDTQVCVPRCQLYEAYLGSRL